MEPALLLGAADNDWGGSGTGEAILLPAGVIAPAPDHCQDLSSIGYHFIGAGSDHNAGYAVASAGDLDNDGLAELLIGEPGPGGDDNEARVYLFRSGVVPDVYTELANSPTHFKSKTNDGVGTALAPAGDINGDLLDDFLIGAPGNDLTQDDAGAVYVMMGHQVAEFIAAGPAELEELAAPRLLGEYAGDHAGYAVAGVGDLDGNGYSDFVVGAPGHDGANPDAGVVYLQLGHDGPLADEVSLALSPMVFLGGEPGDLTGSALAGAGDVNDDGYDDLLVGAFGTAVQGTATGTAFLVLGTSAGQDGTESIAEAAVAHYRGEAANDLAAFSVAGVGDVSGDGIADLLIGAPGNDEGGGVATEPLDGAGKVYLVAGEAAQDQDGDGYYTNGGDEQDCDDNDPTVHPGADEICDDGADNDCDGDVDGQDSDCDDGDDDDDDDNETPFAEGNYSGGGFICSATGGHPAAARWLVALAALLILLGRRRTAR